MYFGTVSAILVIVAGLMSGLTLGLLSVTETELEVCSALCALHFQFSNLRLVLARFRAPIR